MGPPGHVGDGKEGKEAVDSLGPFPRPRHPLPSNLSSCRALGHVPLEKSLRDWWDPSPLQVAVKVRGVEFLEHLLEVRSTHSPEVSGGAQEPSSSADPARTLLWSG